MKRIHPEDLELQNVTQLDWNIGICSIKMQNYLDKRAKLLSGFGEKIYFLSETA
jgi:hypothetical protein